MKNILLLSAIIFSISCSTQDPKSEVGNKIRSNHMSVSLEESKNDSVRLSQIIQNMKDYSTEFYSYPIKFPDNYSREDHFADIEGFLAFQDLDKLLKVHLKQRDIADDATIKTFLSKNKSEKYYFQLAQWAALTVLDQKLLKKEDNSQDKESIAYYSNILLDQEYHHSEVIAKSLQALKGYWNKNIIEEKSRVCLQRTMKYNLTYKSSLTSIKESDRIGNKILIELMN